jgi:hypothetical protein
MLGLRHQPAKEAALSLAELTKSRDVLAHVLSIAGVNQLGRETGQAKRLRTVTPHRLILAIVSALAGERVESLADLLRTFNHQNGVRVAYKPFYNRLARTGFEAFMRESIGGAWSPGPGCACPGSSRNTQAATRTWTWSLSAGIAWCASAWWWCRGVTTG